MTNGRGARDDGRAGMALAREPSGAGALLGARDAPSRQTYGGAPCAAWCRAGAAEAEPRGKTVGAPACGGRVGTARYTKWVQMRGLLACGRAA